MNTSVLIKTFQRPSAVRRLVESIRKYYPDILIYVIDDSENRDFVDLGSSVKYLWTDFDIGISAGRNLGVNEISDNPRIKYIFTCDDDNIFTEHTNLELAEKLIEASGVDILGVQEIGNSYYGLFQTEGDTVRYVNGNKGEVGGVTIYDFVPNLFLAKTESLKQYKWDESLKIGEHFAYFYKHFGKIKVGFTSRITLEHDHIGSPNYDWYRQRAEEYVKKFMKENGIRKRIGLGGDIIEV